jgi:hypothetical protein
MKKVQFLFPSDVTFARVPDECYLEEYEAAQDAGYACSIFASDPSGNDHQILPRPALVQNLPVVYRGWMKTPEQYRKLDLAISQKGASLMTSPEAYASHHHLEGWYGLCHGLTPQTIVLPIESSADQSAKALQVANWQKVFVKDSVKSLSTGRGPVAHSTDEVMATLAEMIHYRGSLEGSICLREFEAFEEGTERRYFVIKGVGHSAEGRSVPPIVSEVAKRLSRYSNPAWSDFYSVDVVNLESGGHRVVEIGDGQVSDTKEWTAKRLIQLFD